MNFYGGRRGSSPVTKETRVSVDVKERWIEGSEELPVVGDQLGEAHIVEALSRIRRLQCLEQHRGSLH
jgi:hypothetical protein